MKTYSNGIIRIETTAGTFWYNQISKGG